MGQISVGANKPTKKAAEDQRIASAKIAQALSRLADLQRTEPQERDNRIFPGHFCPVMIWEDGRRVVKPMRYQCRPAGKPAFYDTKYPGTYNASGAFVTVMSRLSDRYMPDRGPTHALNSDITRAARSNVHTPRTAVPLQLLMTLALHCV